MNDENKNGMDAENIENVNEETVEETVEVPAEETVEETAEEAVLEDTETEEAVAEEQAEGEEVTEEASEEDAVSEKKPLSRGAVAGIIVLAAAVTALVILLVMNIVKGAKNGDAEKYNSQYPDVSGITIAEMADLNGMEFEEFARFYDLPEDMSPEVSSYAAIQNIPIGTYEEKVRGTGFEAAKEFYQWDDSVTEETPYGEAMDKVALSRYFGADYVEQAKELFGLDDSVTGDTLYGEIRPQVEQKQIEMRKEQEAAANATEESTEEAEEDAEEADDEVTEEATEEAKEAEEAK